MKKALFIAAICLISMAGLFAQDWSSSIYSVGTMYPGYIIKNDGSKTEGYLEAQQRGSIEGMGNSNQNRVVFFTDPKSKKTKTTYKPDDLKEYMIADKVYRTMNYSGGLVGKPLRFLLLVKDGHIARYAWYDHKGYENVNVPTFENKIIFQKGDEKPVDMTSFGLAFAKKMSAYVDDYKEMSDKIANKEKGYGMLKLYEIIDEYNAWWEKNNAGKSE